MSFVKSTHDRVTVKIALLNAQKTARALQRLISRCERISVAVAWAYDGPLADALLDNVHKFMSVTIGLNGFATSPALVERLVDIPNVFGAKCSPGLFHPKIYYFESGDEAEAIVGSANFTRGGLGRNVEASLHLRGPTDSDIFVDLREELARYDDFRFDITEPIASAYKAQHKIASAKKGPRDAILPGDGKAWDQLNSELATMGWGRFAARVNEDEYLKVRLDLLQEFAARFAEAHSTSTWTIIEWKALAGILGTRERDENGLGGQDWGWFGSMRGHGDFKRLVGQRDASLAVAIDAIPLAGEVSEEDYRRFCEHFKQAFRGAAHGGGVPTASRLLAMKRPDTFVCVNRMNRRALGKALAFAYTSLDLDNYWERIVMPIRISPWYNAPSPRGRNEKIWNGRVALLDAIYYDPEA